MNTNLKLWVKIFLFAGAVCNSGLGLYSLAHNQVVFGVIQIIFGIVLMVFFTLLLLKRD